MAKKKQRGQYGQGKKPRKVIFELPEKLGFLLGKKARYKVVYGGRASCKSWSVARALIARSLQTRVRIMCVREYQTSLAQSVHKLLSDQIHALGVESKFDIQKSTIICFDTGSEFLFYGIRTDPAEVKSTEGIDICWVEEAEAVSPESWRALVPTIRKPGSEIWVTFNPRLQSDETWKRFVISPPEDAIIVKVSWRDNEWYNEEMEKERLWCQQNEPNQYENIWEGEPGLLGDAFFEKEHLDAAKTDLLPPLATGILEQVGDQIRFKVHPRGWLEIWELPNEQWDYVLGADVSEGTADGDQHSGHVLRRGTFSAVQVARFAPQIGVDDMGRNAVLVAKWYGGRVPLAIERTGGWGIAAIIAARDTGYPHLFQMPKASAAEKEELSDKFGWETTTSSRSELLSGLYAGLRDRTLVMRSETTWRQFQTFIKTITKPKAAEGTHDDEVLGLGIAHQVLLKTHPIPRSVNSGSGRPHTMASRGKALSYMGA